MRTSTSCILLLLLGGAAPIGCGGKGGDTGAATDGGSSTAVATAGSTGSTGTTTTTTGETAMSATATGATTTGTATTGTTGSSSGGEATGGASTVGGSSTGEGTGGSGSSGSSGSGSSGSGGSDVCPEGTCMLVDGGPCEMPTGPQGNGCCKCGADDLCAQFCRCAAPDTPIATPAGEVAIASLRPHDLVYSVDAAGAVVVVPVLKVSKLPAPAGHVAVRVRLASGRSFEMSPGHPTAAGGRLAALAAGDLLGDEEVAAVDVVPYAYATTHDILPASASGAYFAAGALVGSTLVEVGRGAGE